MSIDNIIFLYNMKEVKEMLDFDKSLFENTRDNVLICAHRGLCGGNIPCNTLAAFAAALEAGADIVELDVIKSIDGELFVFHPGKEWAHLRTRIPLASRSAKSIEKLRYVNYDDVKTHYKVERLEDALLFLKGKCYINIDKFWMNIPEITAMIRKCGVEKQVIVKSYTKESSFRLIEKYAPDLMFIPMIKCEDTITEKLIKRKINYVGAEVLFKLDTDPVASKAYADEMHSKGLVIFKNSIVYNEKSVISAGKTDDNAIVGRKDENWGILIENGADIIQTDFPTQLRQYLDSRK